MSGCSETQECPRCGNQSLECSRSSDPKENSGTCFECGYCYYTEIGLLTLPMLNSERVDDGLEPLKERAPEK